MDLHIKVSRATVAREKVKARAGTTAFAVLLAAVKLGWLIGGESSFWPWNTQAGCEKSQEGTIAT